jgi:hypothetical protein
MPVFISYSHADKSFVDSLAKQLVANRVSVWLDKWEIHAGDSLLIKIQNAISGASALLVILSKASVKSEWCTKELNAGLMRELDEKRVVVVPVLVENCEIPVFLREKLYADFRTNFDQGLNTVLESVARITNVTQGRIESPNYHTDWAIDWGTVDGRDVFRLTMVYSSPEQPYTVLGEITILGDASAARWYRSQVGAGTDKTARENILLALESAMRDDDKFTYRLTDQVPRQGFVTFDLHGGTFGATMTVRRLGMDTGRDIIMRMDGQVKNVGESIRAARARADGYPGSGSSSTQENKKPPAKRSSKKKAPKKTAKKSKSPKPKKTKSTRK